VKIIVMQVPDTRHEDDIQIAIAVWNDQNGPERQIDVRFQTSFYGVPDPQPGEGAS
jgi:hypothetical protein